MTSTANAHGISLMAGDMLLGKQTEPAEMNCQRIRTEAYVDAMGNPLGTAKEWILPNIKDEPGPQPPWQQQSGGLNLTPSRGQEACGSYAMPNAQSMFFAEGMVG